ncbi:3-phytase [Elsinoe ampelina]|uniref:3-phytase n=1 Tax=Elsinoe ampelina TaxID=302913 RepID=A0A6A6G1F1_9PEZI|nr:3-phytase [Elsinoe ampelina]
MVVLITKAILLASALLPLASSTAVPKPVAETTCGGKKYTYERLAGYGFIAADAVDKFGDNLGGLGSAIFVEKGSWRQRRDGSYTGTLWALPDRGWNTQGTLNFQNRVHKFEVTLDPKPRATVERPSGPNFDLKYKDTIRFTAPDGQPTTGLDPKVKGPYLSFPGFDFELPSATYPGDGFGGPGPGGERVSIDSEGLVIDNDGYFWVSDEYGPFVYRFNKKGRMVSAIKPPGALIPRRNGTTSYNSNTAPFFNPDFAVDPEDPTSGRSNNQGFEGLTISPDGKTLSLLLQSATIQDGGSRNPTRRNTRFLQYDITKTPPRYIKEYIVPLPFTTPNATRTTAQSEVLYVSDTQFLILARDSNAGAGLEVTESLYRHADVFDISRATNVKSPFADAVGGQIASDRGLLNANITAAEYCSFVDYNINSQLNRFGVRNGGPPGEGLLNEKWESLALVPVDGKEGKDGEFFLISLSDNDFITQNGFLNEGRFRYSDASGNDLLNQALVFRVKIPREGRRG